MAASRSTSQLALRLACRRNHQLRHRQIPLPPTARPFTTTHSLKAVRDNSTIDFAYLPSANVDPYVEPPLRVPIIFTGSTTTTTSHPELSQTATTEQVMKPEISTMSADAVFTPLADLSDGHGLNIDFHAMADRVAAGLKKIKDREVPAEEQASLMKQLWNDMVDDMLGGRKKGGPR
ncbi:hypothetical protein BDY17DRAFT_326888 [Neohortaea acidophila]|uniref:Uncharacterized protein n=1 Tax=Neohortaea acidophila TaxID=245834 RepID=A0A6A6PK51_9PEZI|nr:uncharacterized protein BDY17DRAFT_326888 [Neohortaea acidophila]KAF2479883.1 hypothetical protein BDY17DRAFT_326888 [Neohortaea acidophila]